MPAGTEDLRGFGPIQANAGPKALVELNALILATPPFVPGASRPVLGEGPAGALIALVGEQPGNAEHLSDAEYATRIRARLPVRAEAYRIACDECLGLSKLNLCLQLRGMSRRRQCSL